MSSVFTSFRVEVDEVVEGDGEGDGEGRKVIVMYISAFGETSVGEYRNQYVWRMRFTKDGSKIDEWSEFVDVGVARDFYPLLKGEIGRRAGAGAEVGGKGVVS